jgi:arylsulfatase A-like enzyme
MTMRSRTRVVVATTAAAAAVAGLFFWSRAVPPPPIGVVIVTLDTTRADRLSPYGFMNVSLPALERLAREGVVFDRASTVAPLTLTAHTSLFTGLLPPHHGVRDNADPPLAASTTTLASVLSARGFKTGAFVGSVVLGPARGLKQGFGEYHGVNGNDDGSEERQRPGNQVMDDAIRWLDTVGQSPFLLWAHLYDAHRPYDPPEPYRSLYGHDLYVGEIAFADSQVGRLMDALERRGLLDRTVFVVTADHGESLGGHGEQDHGIFVYEDVVHVPLIMRAPGVRPSRVGDVVRITDIMPTVLGLLRIPAPPVDGVSLVDRMLGKQKTLDLEAYSESLYPERLGWSPLRALNDGQFKFIEAPRPELYDLDRDPFEERNLYDANRSMADKLAARLAAIGESRSMSGERASVAPALRAQLASLGYVSSAVTRDRSDGSHGADPKDCIGVFSRSPNAPPPSGCRPER